MSVNDIWNKSYVNCGNEMKMKKWSSQWTQYMQLRKEAWKKIHDFNGVWTRDLAITELTIIKSWIFFSGFFMHLHKLRSLWRSFLHFHFVPAYNWPAPNVCGFIAQLVEDRTGNREVMGSNRVEVLNFFFQVSLRNYINCVHCDDHFFIFRSFFD